ncbi:MAG TPA: type II toxin-antitoxin system HicB family antitoxin [Blastocatellia bacterium]
MQYQVFVQSQANNGFIAAVLGMPALLAEGQTKEEAVANAKTALQTRLAQGEIVTIEVATLEEENPLLKYAGVFKDDPTFDEFLAEIEAYRRQVDEEEAQRESLCTRHGSS